MKKTQVRLTWLPANSENAIKQLIGIEYVSRPSVPRELIDVEASACEHIVALEEGKYRVAIYTHYSDDPKGVVWSTAIDIDTRRAKPAATLLAAETLMEEHGKEQEVDDLLKSGKKIDTNALKKIFGGK